MNRISLPEGKAMTVDRNSVRGPFIVREISAEMLRKNPQISKGARMLWLTMKSMADQRTGYPKNKQRAVLDLAVSPDCEQRTGRPRPGCQPQGQDDCFVVTPPEPRA
jgi:hypothetical protein